MTKLAFVYILASRKNGTLYTGVTSDLERRMYQHKHHLLEGFTRRSHPVAQQVVRERPKGKRRSARLIEGRDVATAQARQPVSQRRGGGGELGAVARFQRIGGRQLQGQRVRLHVVDPELIM